MRQRLVDWLQVLGMGALMGTVLMSLLAAWLWWKHGQVTMEMAELPAFALAGLCLLVGGFTLFGGSPGVSLRESGYSVMSQSMTQAIRKQNQLTRLQQGALGLILLIAGVWSMALLFLFDYLTF